MGTTQSPTLKCCESPRSNSAPIPKTLATPSNPATANLSLPNADEDDIDDDFDDEIVGQVIQFGLRG